jgi:hypothetical protein
MQKHEMLAEKVLIILSPVMINIGFGSILSGIGSVVITVYYLSKLKKEIINPDYGGSWVKYIKSIIKK